MDPMSAHTFIKEKLCPQGYTPQSDPLSCKTNKLSATVTQMLHSIGKIPVDG